MKLKIETLEMLCSFLQIKIMKAKLIFDEMFLYSVHRIWLEDR